MSARRAAPADLPDLLRAALPLALIVLAAAVPGTRPFVLVALVAGVAVGIHRDAPVRWAWAAPLPVAVGLCWGLIAAPGFVFSGSDCTTAGPAPAIWSVAQGAVVLGVLATLGVALRASAAGLGLRWPARHVVRLTVIGVVVIAALGLLFASLVAGPTSEPFTIDGRVLGILGPALLFAVASGVTEELAYRGAFVAWSGRVTGTWLAVIVQAVVYGLAHGFGDPGGTWIVTVATFGGIGLGAGAVAVRTRSLLLPIAWHVALAAPLYVLAACAPGSAARL